MLLDLGDAEVEAMLASVMKIRARMDALHAQRSGQTHGDDEVQP